MNKIDPGSNVNNISVDIYMYVLHTHQRLMTVCVVSHY